MTRRDDILLLDVGGTTIKCGDGRMVLVPSGGSRSDIAAAFRKAVEGWRDGEGFWNRDLQVGVSIPGPFDYATGTFLMKHKFVAVYGEDFRSLAGLSDSADVRFVHDVVAVLRGACPEGKTIAVFTLGTGLGFCHAENGVVRIAPSGAPEVSIWNMPWGDGILEDKVSARGIKAEYGALGGNPQLSAAQIARRAYDGEETAAQTFSNLGTTLGEALAPILEDLGVKTLLAGGQISRSLSLFRRPLVNALGDVEVLPVPEGAVFRGIQSLFDE